MGLIIRWMIGAPADKPLDIQGFEMLDASLASAYKIWPDAVRIVTVGYLNEDQHEALDHLIDNHRDVIRVYLVGRNGEKGISVLPEGLNKPDQRNCFWRFAPFRYGRYNDHELMLDNDVVFWREPPTIALWRTSDKPSMLIQGNHLDGVDRPGVYGNKTAEYGQYKKQVKELNSSLSICAGVIGWGPGVLSSPYPLESLKPYRFFTDEQGYLALCYLEFKASNHRLPAVEVETYLMDYTEVPIINSQTLDAAALIERYPGAHFTTHNIGRSRAWEKQYRDAVIEAVGDLYIERPAAGTGKYRGGPFGDPEELTVKGQVRPGQGFKPASMHPSLKKS